MEFTRRVSSDAKFRCRKEKVREKYICLRYLRRILNKRELNYENIYSSAWIGCDARFGLVRVGGACHHHNDHNARDNHSGAADSDTTDYDYVPRRPLITGCYSQGARRAIARSFAYCADRKNSRLESSDPPLLAML